MEGQLVEQMKHDVRYACRVMLLTIAAMYAVEFLLCDVLAQFYWTDHPMASLDEVLGYLNASGTLMILAEGSAAAVACLLLTRSRSLHMFCEKREADFSRMCVFFFCLLGMQVLVSLIIVVMEFALNAGGLSLTGALDAASTVELTPSMLAYSVLLAPVFEELIFRGAFLHYLAPCGKRFAIVFSALLFGLMHGNIVQLPVAFFLGILLGYIAIEYSLQAAMVLHSLCNVFVTAQSLLLQYDSAVTAGLLDLLVYVGLGVLSVVALKNRTAILQYAREQRGLQGTAKAVLTSASFWLLAVITLIFTFRSVGLL